MGLVKMVVDILGCMIVCGEFVEGVIIFVEVEFCDMLGVFCMVVCEVIKVLLGKGMLCMV